MMKYPIYSSIFLNKREIRFINVSGKKELAFKVISGVKLKVKLFFI